MYLKLSFGDASHLLYGTKLFFPDISVEPLNTIIKPTIYIPQMTIFIIKLCAGSFFFFSNSFSTKCKLKSVSDKGDNIMMSGFQQYIAKDTVIYF